MSERKWAGDLGRELLMMREGERNGGERFFPELNACVIITVSSVGGSSEQHERE